MSNEENGLAQQTSINPSRGEVVLSTDTSNNFITNFASVITDGLLEENNNNSNNFARNTDSTSTPTIQGLPVPSASGSDSCGGGNENKSQGNDANLIIINIASSESSGGNGTLITKQENNSNSSYLQLESSFSISPSPRSCNSSSLEGTSLESEAGTTSTVSFLTEIEIIPGKRKTTVSINNKSNSEALTLTSGDVRISQVGKNEQSAALTMETESSVDVNKGASATAASGEEATNEGSGGGGDGGMDVAGAASPSTTEDEEGGGAESGDYGEDGGYGEGDGGEDDDDEDTTTLSSEAVVDDIELILMPEMCQDLSSQSNLSPKLVRVTELKMNMDDVFGDEDDGDDDDQSGRHDFRSIVDEVCEEGEEYIENEEGRRLSRLSVGDDDASSGSELIGGGGSGRKGASGSSSSSGRRRRSTSGRISSGVQTDITAVGEEPSALLSSHGHHHHGYRRKSAGKSSLSSRLGVPASSGGAGGGGASGKKLNWKSELTLLPSKMKVKQAGFNSFESNDERDQYSPRVAKFTSQDTLNLSSQFLKPSTLYRTRNLSRNLNQFASSESTFMLPMSSEQQLSADSPRFRDRVSSSTSGGGGGCGSGGAGNFKGSAASHSCSAYQISSMLSGSSSGGMGLGGGGGYYGSSSGATICSGSARRQPLTSGYSSAGMMMMMSGSRHFRSSMPDLNAVNKSYAAAMADSHRRRQPARSIKHHHSSSGFRLQKRSSSDEETSSLIDESERCLRSSIDLLLTDELPSPGADSSCFRSTGFGSSSLAATAAASVTTGLYYSGRRSCSQPILNDQAYPPEMRDASMGSPFLPRKLSDMRCSRWAKVILPNGHVAVVSVKETDEIQDSLTVHTDTGCVITLPFRKVVFAWKSKR